MIVPSSLQTVSPIAPQSPLLHLFSSRAPPARPPGPARPFSPGAEASREGPLGDQRSLLHPLLRPGRSLRRPAHPALLVPGDGRPHALLLVHRHAAPVRDARVVAGGRPDEAGPLCRGMERVPPPPHHGVPRGGRPVDRPLHGAGGLAMRCNAWRMQLQALFGLLATCESSSLLPQQLLTPLHPLPDASPTLPA